MARRYLKGGEWKKYQEVIQKQLNGQRTSKKENRLQQKGDAEVKKSYGNIPI